MGGDEVGKYYLLIGEKGTGKTSMLLSAMDKVGGLNCAMMEAHADSEIFRIRLGKCLDYEFVGIPEAILVEVLTVEA